MRPSVRLDRVGPRSAFEAADSKDYYRNNGGRAPRRTLGASPYCPDFGWPYLARCDAAKWGRVLERPISSAGNVTTASAFSADPSDVRRLGEPPSLDVI